MLPPLELSITTLLLTAPFLPLPSGWLSLDDCWSASLTAPSCFIWVSLANSPEDIANSPFYFLPLVVVVLAARSKSRNGMPPLLAWLSAASLGSWGEFKLDLSYFPGDLLLLDLPAFPG